jgi:glycosyltransferase involved in cell wall biosynthesis
MKNLLVCVLTDRYPEKLERCIVSIDNQKTDVGRIVVCNTLNPDYIPVAEAIAIKHGWDFIVTESNGTASKGKNTALDHFATTGYDYLTLIDGDDYYEPESLGILQRTIEKYDPDVVGLIGSSVVYDDKRIPLDEWEASDDWREKCKKDITMLNAKKLFFLFERAKKYIEFNRFVVISKRCLRFFRFSENIRISDIHLSLKLKHYTKQQLLRYILLDSDKVYTYDGNDFGCFAHFLRSDPKQSIEIFWGELEGMDFTGEIPTVRDEDG